MPKAPMKFCAEPGCPNLTPRVRCNQHSMMNRAERQRFTAGRYGRPWRRERDKFLADNPWCAECLKRGRHIVATIVDHIIPHRGDETLFWDQTNWQSLCGLHHGQKTAAESWG